MTKDLKEGREYHDGEAVTEYVGRFAKSFSIEEEQGLAMSKGDLVSFLVTVRVGDSKYSNTKEGSGQQRANTFNIEDATPVDLLKAQWLYDQMGKKVFGVNDGYVETPKAQETKTDGGFWE